MPSYLSSENQPHTHSFSDFHPKHISCSCLQSSHLFQKQVSSPRNPYVSFTMVPQLRVLLVVVVIGCVLRGADASATSKANDLKAVYLQFVQEGQEEGKDCRKKANIDVAKAADYAGLTGAEIVSDKKKNPLGYTDKEVEASFQFELTEFQKRETHTKKTRCIAKKDLVCSDDKKCVKCSEAKPEDDDEVKNYCHYIEKIVKAKEEKIASTKDEKVAKAGGGMKTPMMAVGTILVALLAFFSSQ